MTNTILAVTLLAASATLARADRKPPEPKPEPTDPKLAQLVGRWEGASTFTIRGETTKLTTTAHCQRAVVGPAVVCTIVAVGGARRLEEVHLLGYDKASDTYHLFTVNNWGEAYDHAAKWSDPHRVAFVHTGTRDGKALREVYEHRLQAKEWTVEGAISVDGKVFATGASTLKRVP